MRGLLLVTLGLFAGASTISAPALAVSSAPDRGGPSAPGAVDRRGPEYSFSGDRFNLSISRAPSRSDEERRLEEETSAPVNRDGPTWFGRLRRFVEGMFGD